MQSDKCPITTLIAIYIRFSIISGGCVLFFGGHISTKKADGLFKVVISTEFSGITAGKIFLLKDISPVT